MLSPSFHLHHIQNCIINLELLNTLKFKSFMSIIAHKNLSVKIV